MHKLLTVYLNDGVPTFMKTNGQMYRGGMSGELDPLCGEIAKEIFGKGYKLCFPKTEDVDPSAGIDTLPKDSIERIKSYVECANPGIVAICNEAVPMVNF